MKPHPLLFVLFAAVGAVLFGLMGTLHMGWVQVALILAVLALIAWWARPPREYGYGLALQDLLCFGSLGGMAGIAIVYLALHAPAF